MLPPAAQRTPFQNVLATLDMHSQKSYGQEEIYQMECDGWYVALLERMSQIDGFRNQDLLRMLADTVTSPKLISEAFDFLGVDLEKELPEIQQTVTLRKKVVEKTICHETLSKVIQENEFNGVVPWYILLFLLLSCPKKSDHRTPIGKTCNVIPIQVNGLVRYAVIGHTKSSNEKWTLISVANASPLPGGIPRGHNIVLCEPYSKT